MEVQSVCGVHLQKLVTTYVLDMFVIYQLPASKAAPSSFILKLHLKSVK